MALTGDDATVACVSFLFFIFLENPDNCDIPAHIFYLKKNPKPKINPHGSKG
jgi:hypothetical protein